MRVAKRILFVVAFMPVSVYAWIRWIATGEHPLDVLEAFED